MADKDAKLERIVGRKGELAGTVFFLHGLEGDAFTTWGGEKNSPHFWPRWLKGEVPHLEVYSLSYPTKTFRFQSGADFSLEEIAVVVFDLLKQAPPRVFDSSIAFVCHSLGGLIVKELLRLATKLQDDATQPLARKLLSATSRVFFVATPHSGSAVANVGTLLKLTTGLTAEDLTIGNKRIADLGDWYREFCAWRRAELKTLAYYEKQKTGPFLLKKIVVDKESADPKVGSELIPIDRDHRDIVKPSSTDDRLFKGIVRELNEMVEQPNKFKQPAPANAQIQAKSKHRYLHPLVGGMAASAILGLMLTFILRQPQASPQAQQTTPVVARQEPQPASKPAPPQAKDVEIERRRLAEEEARKLEAERLRQQAIAEQKVREEYERRVEEQKRRAEAEQQERLRREDEIKRAEAERLEREKLQELQKAEEAAKAVVRQAQAIQEGLRRAGCFRGPVSGQWGPLTKAAVAKYNKHASVLLLADRPTPEAEAALLAVKTRVCPVACDPPKIEQNGACVSPSAAVGCPPGKADVGGGQCEAPYVAWVGADTTESGAKALFATLQQRHADLLAARQLDIRARQNPDRFSVRIGPAAKREAAQELCNRLRAAGLNGKCYPEPL